MFQIPRGCKRPDAVATVAAANVEQDLDTLRDSSQTGDVPIPDAALPALLAVVAGALQCPDLPSRTSDLLHTCWWHLSCRLDRLIPGAVDHLELNDPLSLSSEYARALVSDEWPDAGEELHCWQTTEHDQAEDYQ